jgi:hypothetical protein
MKYILILASAIVLFAACSASITEVKPGMTSAEVEKILGKANHSTSSSSSSSLNDGTVTEVSSAEWNYNDKGTVKFENDKVVSVNLVK